MTTTVTPAAQAVRDRLEHLAWRYRTGDVFALQDADLLSERLTRLGLPAIANRLDEVWAADPPLTGDDAAQRIQAIAAAVPHDLEVPR